MFLHIVSVNKPVLIQCMRIYISNIRRMYTKLEQAGVLGTVQCRLMPFFLSIIVFKQIQWRVRECTQYFLKHFIGFILPK